MLVEPPLDDPLLEDEPLLEPLEDEPLLEPLEDEPLLDDPLLDELLDPPTLNLMTFCPPNAIGIVVI